MDHKAFLRWVEKSFGAGLSPNDMNTAWAAWRGAVGAIRSNEKPAPAVPKHDGLVSVHFLRIKPAKWLPPDNEERPNCMVFAAPGEDYEPLFTRADISDALKRLTES